ncbi:MAG: hypothetical protein AAFU61_03415 [Pseudomonadota bacterium]
MSFRNVVIGAGACLSLLAYLLNQDDDRPRLAEARTLTGAAGLPDQVRVARPPSGLLGGDPAAALAAATTRARPEGAQDDAELADLAAPQRPSFKRPPEAEGPQDDLAAPPGAEAGAEGRDGVLGFALSALRAAREAGDRFFGREGDAAE